MKYRVALISPYPEMMDLFCQLAANENIDLFSAQASLQEAVAIAQSVKDQTEVFVSRGGTADWIRQAVSVPIVSVPITPFDVAKVLCQLEKSNEKVAFFQYKENLYGIRELEQMSGRKIQEYTFLNESDLQAGVAEAARQGIGIAIGGSVTVTLAQQHGMQGLLVECGEAAVFQSLREALHLAAVRREERNKALRIRMALESITEGVIVTDEQNFVRIYNPAAERLFRIPAAEILNCRVQDVIPNTRMHNVLASGKAEMAELQEVHGGTIATNRIPIIHERQPVGVVSTFQDITKVQMLEQRIRRELHTKGFIAKHHLEDVLTRNENLIAIKKLASIYAASDSAVLIQGESGTGKELFAQGIHNASPRSSQSFVALNCAAISTQLLESELFGYERGSFTGARKEGKSGLFELAHGGTLFLDEIGEIPRPLQARLLRVLQEKEIMRVGGDRIIPVDVRIISATNQNLSERVQQKEFREDLFYRLNVCTLNLPSLRDRPEDISLLVRCFLGRSGFDALAEKISTNFFQALTNHNWPGNVRELQNVMERLALVRRSTQRDADWLELLRQVMPVKPGEQTLTIQISVQSGYKSAIEAAETAILRQMAAACGNNYSQLAQQLGIGRTTLWRKLRQLNVSKHE